MLRCPDCKSYGIYPIKRRWWQRFLKVPHRYHCQDCGRDYRHGDVLNTRSRDALEVAEPEEVP